MYDTGKLANHTLWSDPDRLTPWPATSRKPQRLPNARALKVGTSEPWIQGPKRAVLKPQVMAFPHHTVTVVFRDLMILRAFELGDGTGMGLNAERAFDQGSRPHLRVSHVPISCFCIWRCVRLAMTLQNRLHRWFVFIDFSLQEACCPRWWEAAITNSSCLAEKVPVWLRASLISILQKVVDFLRGVATTGFYHLFILFGVHKPFPRSSQGVSWSFWDLSHVNMLQFHMNPSVPVASRSNQAGHSVDIDMEIPAENDQSFISFILWCILWLTAIRIKNLYFEVIRKMRYSYSLSLGLMGPVRGRGGAGFGAMRPRVATWRMCKMLEQAASRGGN